MRRRSRFLLVMFMLTILACSSLFKPSSTSPRATRTPWRVQMDHNDRPTDIVSRPTYQLQPTKPSTGECNAKMVITGVDQIDRGDGTKIVLVRIGLENRGSLWARLKGPDDDEDTETQKSVFITTKDGSIYGFIGRMSHILSEVSDQNPTIYEVRNGIVTPILPPGFSILGQTVLGKPHYYKFVFQLPNAEIPKFITIRNMWVSCIAPPIIGEDGRAVNRGDGTIPDKTYNLITDIADVRRLPSTRKYPNLVGSKIEMSDQQGVIEFTGATRDGNAVNIVFDYINPSLSNEAYPSFNGYIIGNSGLSSCQTIAEHNCEIQPGYPSYIAVQPGQTAKGLVWSFTVPENETNLMFVYVYSDESDVNQVYKLDVDAIAGAKSQTQPTDITPVTATQENSANNDVEDAVTINPLCRNDYFPVVKGAKWVYKITVHSLGTDPPSIYTLEEIAEILPDGFNLFMNSSVTEEFVPKDKPSDYYFRWECLSDGLASTLASGIEIPKDMPAGFTWTQKSLVGASVETIWTSLGVESVTVPAGTFDAVKVKGDVVSTDSKTFYFWYVAGIGKVKSEYEYSGGWSVYELVSYSIPK